MLTCVPSAIIQSINLLSLLARLSQQLAPLCLSGELFLSKVETNKSIQAEHNTQHYYLYHYYIKCTPSFNYYLCQYHLQTTSLCRSKSIISVTSLTFRSALFFSVQIDRPTDRYIDRWLAREEKEEDEDDQEDCDDDDELDLQNS